MTRHYSPRVGWDALQIACYTGIAGAVFVLAACTGDGPSAARSELPDVTSTLGCVAIPLVKIQSDKTLPRSPMPGTAGQIAAVVDCGGGTPTPPPPIGYFPTPPTYGGGGGNPEGNGPGGGGLPGGGGGGTGCTQLNEAQNPLHTVSLTIPGCQAHEWWEGPSDPDAYGNTVDLPKILNPADIAKLTPLAVFDCRKVRCPPPSAFLNSAAIQDAVRRLHAKAAATGTGKEYGAWLFLGPDGNIVVGGDIEGAAGQMTAMDPTVPGNVPPRAIGWIHTHYWDYSPPLQYEPRDASNAAYTHTYAVVGTPTIIILLGPDGQYKGYTPRTP